MQLPLAVFVFALHVGILQATPSTYFSSDMERAVKISYDVEHEFITFSEGLSKYSLQELSFENSLEKWFGLLDKSQNFLSEMEEFCFSNELIYESCQRIHHSLERAIEDLRMQDALKCVSRKILNNASSEPFHRYVSKMYLGIGEENFLCLKGENIRNLDDLDFNFLKTKSYSLTDAEFVSSDFLMIENMNPLQAYHAYQKIQNQYASIFYINGAEGSFLIASKNPLIENKRELNFRLNSLDKVAFYKNDVILIGHAEVSASTDSEGNSSLEASISDSTETEQGTLSGGVKGGVYQDQDGNTSGRVEGVISFDW